jgi:hypothetical protein
MTIFLGGAFALLARLAPGFGEAPGTASALSGASSVPLVEKGDDVFA